MRCPMYNTRSFERGLFESLNQSENSGAGWSSLVARRAHNPKVVGSNPAPATKQKKLINNVYRLFFRLLIPCYKFAQDTVCATA